MGYSSVLTFCLVCVLTLSCYVECGEYCVTDEGTRIIFCDHGCCGDDRNDQECCQPIVWIIVGCILAVLFIVAVIIVIVCVFYKSKGKSGRVVHPVAPTATVTYIPGTINHGYPGQPTAPPSYGLNYPVQPPPYNQPQPPPYSQPYGHPPPSTLYPPQQPMAGPVDHVLPTQN